MIRVDVGVGDIAGLSDVECACILGSVALAVGVAIGAVIGTFDSASTLEASVGGFESFSGLLRVSAIFCRSLRVGSPGSKIDVVVEGGAIRMVIVSVAAYLKKSSKPTFGIGISQ